MTALAARLGSRLTRSFRSDVTASRAGVRLRVALAVVFAAYSAFLVSATVGDGRIPGWPQFIMLLMAVTLLAGRGGGFVRDWAPVILGVLAYTQGSLLVERLRLPVHYTPQIDADRIIGLGHVPSAWLQAHLYHGRTGPLEIAVLLAYASHFVVPLGVAFYVWWARGRRVFNTLVLTLLVVSVLAEITFVLAPTAPPWLAAQNGHLAGIHPILKQALASLHLGTAAALKGDSHTYNIVAAVPSLHVALPVVGLLVIRWYRLPRWVLAIQAIQLAAVLFAIVYAGEHYVVDALAGAVYALAAWRIVMRTLRTTEEVELRPSVAGAARVRPARLRPRPLRTLVPDDGQALFEYAAVVSVVSIAAVGVLTLIGNYVNFDLTQILGGF